MSYESAKKRLEAATSGEWIPTLDSIYTAKKMYIIAVYPEDGDETKFDALLPENDANFIARSKQDMQVLLDIALSAEKYLEASKGDKSDALFWFMELKDNLKRLEKLP